MDNRNESVGYLLYRKLDPFKYLFHGLLSAVCSLVVDSDGKSLSEAVVPVRHLPSLK